MAAILWRFRGSVLFHGGMHFHLRRWLLFLTFSSPWLRGGWGIVPAFVLIFSMLTQTATATERATITLEALILEMTDFDAIARWPSPEFVCGQASSRDRRSVSPEDAEGWFANDDFSGRLRVETSEGRREEVLMDELGPGCLVRFWMTTDSTHVGGGVLRIYLDDAEEPVLEFPAFDLLSGNLDVPDVFLRPHPGHAPNGLGGSTMMLPVPYANRCKVTWEERSEGKRYYQINFRRYPADTAVETLTMETLNGAQPALMAAAQRLMNPPMTPEGPAQRKAFSLKAHSEERVDLADGPGAIQFFRLRVTTADGGSTDRALRSVIVKMTFDGVRTVWCPASDFFGSGVGVNPMNNWYSTVRKDGTMISRWVMPYERSARVTIENLGEGAISGEMEIGSGRWNWDDRSMHFHTAWKHETGLETPPVSDWNFVSLTGRGVYAGDTLALFNRMPTWYGEGDEKIRVDEEAFPSHFGTGTEDYYNYSFAPRFEMQTPFANLVRVDHDTTQGHNVMSRTRNLDGIPFRTSLEFDLELKSWEPTRLTYSATSRWYAFPGGTSNVEADPEGAAAAIPAPSSVQRP